MSRVRQLLRTSGWSIGVKLKVVLGIVCAPLFGAVVALLWANPRLGLVQLVALGAACGVPIATAMVITRRLSARIRRISEAAEGILSSGDDEVEMPVEVGDEVGQLATVLNAVLYRLRLANEDLVRLVGEHMETLELQRSILDNAAEYAILSDDVSGRIVTANRGASEIFGLLDASELVGRCFADLLTPDEVAAGRTLEILQRTDNGSPWGGNLACQRAGGASFTASVRVSPRRNRLGAVNGRVIILRDISRELKAERRYAELFHSLQGAVYLTTPDGHFLDANQAMARLCGCSTVEELTAVPAVELYADETDREAWLLEVDRTGRMRDHEVTIRRRDGELRTCIESSRVLRAADGSVEAYLGTLLDVTERRRLQKQVARSQRLDAVGTLAGGLAHDFSNILSAIVPNAELIEKHPDTPPAVRERARTIRAASARAGELTRKLLRFARESHDSRNAVDLNLVVAEASRLLEPSLGEGIAYEMDTSSGAPSVLGDATSLQQVVVNLVLNARDAIDGAGRIQVTTERREIDEDYCRGREELRPGTYGLLRVTDDGIGMTAGQMDRVFDPFYTTKESGVGTGLGLSVVYATVSGYGGHVGVRSAPGRGTTIDVLLPEAKRVPVSGGDGGWGRSGQEAGCVLLVDDEEIVRSATAGMLAEIGWRLIAAPEGTLAIDLFRSRRREVDVVLVDGLLLDQSARSVVESIHDLDPDKPIIVMGSEARRTEAAGWRGVAGYLVKPFEYRALSDAMSAALWPQSAAN